MKVKIWHRTQRAHSGTNLKFNLIFFILSPRAPNKISLMVLWHVTLCTNPEAAFGQSMKPNTNFST